MQLINNLLLCRIVLTSNLVYVTKTWAVLTMPHWVTLLITLLLLTLLFGKQEAEVYLLREVI